MKKALFASLFFLYSCSEPVFEYVPLAQAETKLISIEKFNKEQSPKNIILLIGDGTGLSQITLSRLAIGGASHKLAIDQMPFTGFSLTHSSDNLVTDSASSATAWAAGIKTKNKFLSITPQKETVPTIPELLYSKGFLSGLVATSSITHATPAAFYAHVEPRNEEKFIANQLIESSISIALGGGLKFFNLADLEKKTTFISDKESLFDENLKDSKRVIGLFEEGGIVRSPEKPTQNEMTESALNFLSSNTQDCSGFFLMSEGSQIDWAAHDNDAVEMINEYRDFDDTIRAMMNFVSKDKETLLIVTADHETGGLQIMSAEDNKVKVKWGTGRHTGIPVGVYAYGPGAHLFTGTMDNTDIHHKILEVINYSEIKSSYCSK